MRKFLLLLYVGLVLLSIASCRTSDQDHTFQPLGAGRFWLYEVEKITTDGIEHLRHGLRITNRTITEGTITARQEDWIGNISTYRQDERGLFLTSKIENNSIERANSIDMVLPPDPTVGYSWDSISSTQALESSRSPWERLFVIKTNIKILNQVTSINATITTPAGHFEDCLLITSFGRAHFYLGTYLGEALIEQHRKSWYAKGIGLVRLELSEKSDVPTINEGFFTMQLVKHSK